MNCPECNADIEANSIFCPKCGERLDGQENRVGARITADGPSDRESGGDSPSDRFRQQMSAPAAAGDDDDDREIELWVGGFSPKAMFSWWIGSAVLSVILLVGLIFLWAVPFMLIVILVLVALVWLWPACTLMYRRMALRYRLTSQRFIHEHGVLTRETDRIEVIDIDDVSFRQTLVDRFVGVGIIRIESGDRSHPVLVLKGIDDVERVYDLIDDARRKERVRRGIHIATAGQSGM